MKKPANSREKGGANPLHPTFKNSELGPIPADWEVKRLRELCDIQLGKMLDEEKNVGELKPYLGNRAVQWNRIVLDDLPQVRLTDQDMQRYSLCQGDLLVCEGGEVGRAAIWHGELSECYYQKALHRLRARKSDVIDMAFMLQLFHFYAASGMFDSVVTKTSIAHLPKDKLEVLPVACPPLPEQRRIVAVLSDADAWIESLDKLIEKKKLVKQGAMQALLSGKTRLPGFSGKWEERPISDSLMPVSSPAGLIKRNVFHDAKPGAFPAFSASGQDVWLSEAAFHGDGIVVSAIGSRCGKSFLAQGDWGVVANTHVLLPKNDACMAYWFCILDNANWWLKAGTGQPYVLIQASLARTMKVPQPAEQRAIAGVLSDMDAELTALSREKAKAEQIKQGMMQELLTGRVRLKE